MTTTPGRQAPPGMRVGDYTLLSRIGEGGMGVVHLARKPGGERVALKVLRPHVVGDDEARARLAREVNSLTRVRSVRVAEIVDSDPWGPVPFVATRYVPGLSLHDHVREEGPLTGDDLAWFAQGLAEALQAVHRVGVLHRDIKPSNVLMEGRNPVLIDFGLARVADDANITRTGWLLGTPGYLAPEILYGIEPTTAADVHSWAATVAFAGTGRAPYGKGPSVAVMDRVRRGEHDLTGLDPVVLSLVTSALAPEPDQRPSLPQVIETLGGSPTAERPAVPGPAPTMTMPITPGFAQAAQEALDVAAPQTRRFEDDPTRRQPPPAPPSQSLNQPLAGPATEAAPPRPDHTLPPPMREPYQVPAPAGAAPARVSWTERLRRWILGAAVLGAVAGGLVLAPYVVSVSIAVVTVVLRSLSLSATAATDRRGRRGPKWYDGVLNLMAAPWHFLVSLPASIMLLVWTALLVGCVGLVMVALDVDDLTALGVSGVFLGVVHWTGPGSSRLRSPLRRIGLPLARTPLPWLVGVLLLVAASALMVWWAVDHDPVWAPFDESPWAPGTWLGRHL
ncbi:serine/threonine protein kinase [Nocardioides sp. Root151]|uniref:serine/threonine protein kinase n=1 Tax=Nocardioides sp. Root151 TaxID=1736475 RepID=UPI0012E36255|nr:serine/threonine-protein kinase [Nocardioides sp. Root151]